MIELNLSINKRFKPLYEKLTTFFAYHGGRGGGKSWAIADYLLLDSITQVNRVLCCREVQKSIKNSVHKLLKDRIEALGLSKHYQVLDTEIRGLNGSLFVFTGLQEHTSDSIKSFEGVNRTWIEEAQSIRRSSLDILIPTVLRRPDSQIIFSLNPYLPSDPVYQDYIEKQRDDCTVVQINYTDNKHCPPLLIELAEKAKRDDIEVYNHIWLGEVKLIADGAVYKKEFEKVQQDKRICPVPCDAGLLVHTVWDLGVGDSTSIWFAQVIGKEVRLIDYYETSGEGLPHYARVLQEKGYLYGKHFAPHDIAVRELGSGVSRLETARKLGINFLITPSLTIEDGIDAARQLLSTCWFDQVKTEYGLKCLRNYRRE
ncbi:MAG TPA: PBSX family phage terminase large subunit, partial [Paenisporosarcina sp.]|nr:PBSX family phage terminase large subunit [Paenisporosarcina sp.]